ncbi:Receptor protein kinase-like protein [Glycine max]|nr:Receptor protein kinase-like protein [Glycine max]
MVLHACSEIGAPGTPDFFRVTSLALPNSQLLGSISEDLGLIQYLRHIDLSNNFLNGSLPNIIFNSSELQVLSLSNNVISGELPQLIGKMTNLKLVNLSDNAFVGLIPEKLSTLPNLTIVSLKSNYFSGSVPNGFNYVDILDLSSNLLNGSLPNEFGGESLRYLNLSYNKISGTIPLAFVKQIPVNTTVDLSFNNLTGPIPGSEALLNQKTEFLSGNADLCGKPLKILCTVPSTMSSAPPNVTTSSTAIAAIPKTIDSTPSTKSTGSTTSSQNVSQSVLKPATIAAIVVGDLAGMAILALIVLFIPLLDRSLVKFDCILGRKGKAWKRQDLRSQHLGFQQLWEIKIPPRALSFAWRLLWDRLPTKDNLIKRQILVDNDLCPFCHSQPESASHLFFSCAKVLPLWWDFFSWVKEDRVIHCRPIDNFLQHQPLAGSKGSNRRWKMWWIAVTITIWKSSNELIFHNKPFDISKLADSTLFLLWTWLRGWERDFMVPFQCWSSAMPLSGCCKPAEECQFSYVNPTTWTKPTNVTNQSNPIDS